MSLGVLLVGVAWVGPASAQSSTDDAQTKDAPPADIESPGTGTLPPTPPTPTVRDITFPVVGPVTYSDTWGACRSGCSRRHKGVDIFGHKLAPLVAVKDATIVSIRRSALTLAGNKVTLLDDEGWYYLYLHLNNDSPGSDDGANPQGWIVPNRLRVGDRVKAGDVIGYLGDSGNAEATPAHLHFEIHQPEIGAINPTSSVRQAQNTSRVIPVAALASTAPGRAEHAPLISAWYKALLHRKPTSKELTAWADRFDIGFANRDDLIADLTMAPQRRNPAGTVLRVYRVVFGRRPDLDALSTWEEQYRAGAKSEAIAAGLLNSQEFAARGSLSDAQFVDLVYSNSRGKRPTESTRQYWMDQLATTRTRAGTAAYFADSFGVKDATWHELEVMQAFRAALDRLPTDDEVARWRAHLASGGILPDVVDAIKD